MERECSGSLSVGDPEKHFRKKTSQKHLGLQPRQMVQNEEWGAAVAGHGGDIQRWWWLCSVRSISADPAFQERTFRPLAWPLSPVNSRDRHSPQAHVQVRFFFSEEIQMP